MREQPLIAPLECTSCAAHEPVLGTSFRAGTMVQLYLLAALSLRVEIAMPSRPRSECTYRFE